MFNPIAAITETRESTKQNHSGKNKDNKYNRQQHNIFLMSRNNSNNNKQRFNLNCWFCNNNDHKASLCPEIKDLSYSDKIKTIKGKKLCFNCLSNTHVINKCKSKISSLQSNPLATNITTDTEVQRQNVIDQYRTNRAYLQIAPVKLMNKDIVVETNALLHTGSDATLLRSDVVTKLQLKGEDRKLNISSALSHRKNVNSKIVTFDIKLDVPAKSFDIKDWVAESLNLMKVQYYVNEM